MMIETRRSVYSGVKGMVFKLRPIRVRICSTSALIMNMNDDGN